VKFGGLIESRLSHILPTQAYIVLVGNVGDVDGKADDYVVSNVPGGRLVPSSSGRSVCQRVSGWVGCTFGVCFCEPEGWQGWEK
jgi:hypothetical protein